MNDKEPEFWQTASPSPESRSTRRFVERFKQNPTWGAAATGAVFSAILPIIVVMWKIDLCNYGRGDDISGVFICIPPFMVIGATIGMVLGSASQRFSRSPEASDDAKHHGSAAFILACLVAAVVGVAISVVPAAMLAFPDC